jgi:hypothetical protein
MCVEGEYWPWAIIKPTQYIDPSGRIFIAIDHAPERGEFACDEGCTLRFPAGGILCIKAYQAL